MLLKEFCSHANWLAIGVAAIVYYVLGMLWYSVLFKKAWMEGHQMKVPTAADEMAAMKKKMPMMMIMGFLTNVLAAVMVGMFVMALGSVHCVPGIKLGLALSAIAIVPLIMSHIYMMKPLKVWFIDGGYHLIGITLMTIIISVWHK